VALALPANAIDPFQERGPEPSNEKAAAAVDFGFTMAPYKHLGTWVDMYNKKPWKYPETTVIKMVGRGVSTLYLQTSNYKVATRLYKPTKTGRFLDAADAAGIKVVAWYLPGFRNVKKDKHRIRAALDFVSPNGKTFDGFALDIEATLIRDLNKRNRRMLRLSDWLREKVGNAEVLGAIVPDVQSAAPTSYWPYFPYSSVADRFELLMPMSYFTYRVNGREAVKDYITANFTQIRSSTGRPNLPIHNIGGIGGRSSRREARAYVNAVIDNAGFGGSYYDFPITAEREWKELSKLSG
jgi:hypothetical protein